MAAACDSASPRPSKASASRGRVEIHRREQFVVIDQHGRAVAGAVEIGGDRRRGARELIEGRAHSRERGSGTTAGPARVAAFFAFSRSLPASSDSSNREASVCPGAGAARRRGDRAARGWRRNGLERQRAGRGQRLQHERLHRDARARAMPTLKALALSSAIASLGPSTGVAMPALAAAPPRPGMTRAVELRLALADQRQEELGERREIGFAERADAAHAGMQARDPAWRG